MERVYVITVTSMGILGPETRKYLAQDESELETMVEMYTEDLARGEIEGFQVERDEQ